MIPLLILAVHGLALGIGFAILAWMLALHRRQQREENNFSPPINFSPRYHRVPNRPDCWLAVRSASPEAVKLALGLHHAAPCSWEEGLAGGHEFFISPRVHGWVIVTIWCDSSATSGGFSFLTKSFFICESFFRHGERASGPRHLQIHWLRPRQDYRHAFS